jgi:hypothetical protein
MRSAAPGIAAVGAKVADEYGETWPLVALREIEKLPRYVF